jgi:hypothetical protein
VLEAFGDGLLGFRHHLEKRVAEPDLVDALHPEDRLALLLEEEGFDLHVQRLREFID